jgi:hypothetical protein
MDFPLLTFFPLGLSMGVFSVPISPFYRRDIFLAFPVPWNIRYQYAQRHYTSSQITTPASNFLSIMPIAQTTVQQRSPMLEL